MISEAVLDCSVDLRSKSTRTIEVDGRCISGLRHRLFLAGCRGLLFPVFNPPGALGFRYSGASGLREGLLCELLLRGGSC